VLLSFADGIGSGLGYSAAIIIISFFREILGTGGLKIFGIELFNLPWFSSHPLTFFISAPGAFLVIGIFMAILRMTGVIKGE